MTFDNVIDFGGRVTDHGAIRSFIVPVVRTGRITSRWFELRLKKRPEETDTESEIETHSKTEINCQRQASRVFFRFSSRFERVYVNAMMAGRVVSVYRVISRGCISFRMPSVTDGRLYGPRTGGFQVFCFIVAGHIAHLQARSTLGHNIAGTADTRLINTGYSCSGPLVA